MCVAELTFATHAEHLATDKAGCIMSGALQYMLCCWQLLLSVSDLQNATGRDKRPIVEFALESAQAVRKMATKQAWQKSQVQGQWQHHQAFHQLEQQCLLPVWNIELLSLALTVLCDVADKQASKPAVAVEGSEAGAGAGAGVPSARRARQLAKRQRIQEVCC